MWVSVGSDWCLLRGVARVVFDLAVERSWGCHVEVREERG